ncbi:MAG TPA: 2-amino-4-hydroxy-6-hydroxymethyldihydropteridine diphosphokinase [Actinomycetes bacterium]|nr:2-amino-4-hydroxy-6-hydroxymethyldihydropteridine diphosphokinase [Actinomycetes bacterium]
MSDVVRAAFGLGSNVGDRVQHVRDAIAEIGDESGVSTVGVSQLVETDPVGGPEQPEFINAVVVVDTVLQPRELLALAQRCEQRAARVRTERWGPRTLDVDLLAYDDVDSDDPELTLPHPRATQRAFVMVPWAQVDPEFVVSGRTVEEWADLLDASGVRRLRVDS